MAASARPLSRSNSGPLPPPRPLSPIDNMPLPNELTRIIPTVQWMSAKIIATNLSDKYSQNWRPDFESVNGFIKGTLHTSNSKEPYFAFPVAWEKTNEIGTITIHKFGNDWILTTEKVKNKEGKVEHYIEWENLKDVTTLVFNVLNSIDPNCRLRHSSEFV